MGAGIDGHERGEVSAKLTPANVSKMRSAGLKPLAYRLRTELGGEAWHWNPHGAWSDSERQEGYWTGDPQPSSEPIDLSYGYRLPRRGNSIDQANNDGYSRIDDGDPRTFWKSNPYLGDRPQWIAADLGRVQRINTVRIAWGEPRATRYHVDCSEEEFVNPSSSQGWLPLGPKETCRARWLRIVLEESSHTGPALSQDSRDRAGFAVRELEAGFKNGEGRFRDAIRHGTSHKEQTTIWVSSTDPWHRAVDRDPDIEQPGIDRVFQSGLSNGLPLLVSAPVLYDTPENAASLMEYLRNRRYAFTEIELGEEPEEQFVSPEDFGELSRQTASAIRRGAFPVRFGGPSLILLQPNLTTDADWMARLYRYYKNVKSSDLLSFFSFEWYPFDDICGDTADQLLLAPELLKGALNKLASAGIPRTLPWYMTEYGFSAYGARAEVDLPGAIFNAEAVALFLTQGGARAYLYGYEPGELLHDRRCAWGNNMLFFDEKPTAAYWAARLLTESWASADGGLHQVYVAETGTPLVRTYALRRPSGELSVLVVNKSPSLAETLTVPFQGPFTIAQFSGEQYLWLAAGEHGRIVRSAAPAQRHQTSPAVLLPPYSLTVITSDFRESK